MNVMEAFDRCIVKRSSSPTVIKMEAAERPFESANTVADSGVIVKREKLSPIRIVSIRLLYRKMWSCRLDLRFIFIVIILS